MFLDRAGSGTLLEIDIELRSRYCKVFGISTNAWRSQLALMNELLEFLSSHGAGVRRWRSLDVCCKQPEVLINVIEYLSIGVPAAVLQFLRLKRKEPIVYRDSEEYRYSSYPDKFSNKLSKTCPTLPSLRSVEFDLVPWGFVLERPLPLLAGLKRLNLTSPAARPSCVTGLEDLLMASPMLEVLSIDTIFTDNENSMELPCIQLPSLRALSVGSISHPFSTLWILRMIHAPNFHTFFLFRSNLPMIIDNTTVRTEHVFLYLYTGDLPWDMVADAEKRDGPIYPKLCDLNASEMGIYNTCLRDHVDGVLASSQSVTHLTINLKQAELLLEDPEPCMLPNPVHLRISDRSGSCSKLVRMLHFREEQGYPIQVVELSTKLCEQVVKEDFPCTILTHFGENIDTDYDSSRSERSASECEDDEDTEGSEDSDYPEDESGNSEDEDGWGSEEGSD